MARATLTLNVRVAPWVEAYLDAMQRIGVGGGDEFVAAVSAFVLEHGIAVDPR